MADEDTPIELTDDGELVHPLIEDLDRRKKRKGRTLVGRTIHKGVRLIFWIGLILLSALGGVTALILFNNKNALQSVPTPTCTSYLSYLSGNGTTLLVDRIYYPQQTHVVEILNYDGADIQPINNLSKQAESLALSPNAMKLAYVSRNKDGESNIYIADIDGSNATRLFTGIYPSWSPDSNLMAFIGRHKNIWGVYIISVNEPTVQYVVDGLGINDPPIWSPDGKRLILSVNRGVSTDLEMIDIDGTNHQVLVKNGETNRPVAWSPDGQFVAFASGGKLLTLRLSDLKQESLLNDTLYNIRYLVWAADSKHLVVLANTQQQNFAALYNISIDDGTYKVIRNSSC